MFKSLGLKAFTLNFAVLFVFSIFITNRTFANDGGHEAPKADAHGGGHGDDKGKKEDLPPWTEIQNKISQLEARMKIKHENLGKLLVQKQHVKPDSPQVKEIINSMIAEHKELQNLAKEYEKTITVFKFRYPEKTAKADRKYEPTEIKSLEEMEHELGIDGRLTRNMKKLRGQYGEDEVTKKEKANLKNTEPEKKTEKSIEESGTIMLRK